VIWATGFRPDDSWVDLPGVDEGGRVIHERGVTKIPRVYCLGLSWQHTRGSALLGWVGEDANYIAPSDRDLPRSHGPVRDARAGASFHQVRRQT
jgi:putative flavoprotein involved in K+ transport